MEDCCSCPINGLCFGADDCILSSPSSKRLLTRCSCTGATPPTGLNLNENCTWFLVWSVRYSFSLENILVFFLMIWPYDNSCNGSAHAIMLVALLTLTSTGGTKSSRRFERMKRPLQQSSVMAAVPILKCLCEGLAPLTRKTKEISTQ
jgi:hypothetical protein